MSELSPRQLDALDRIELKPSLQPFFFRKLKGLKWFNELGRRRYFNSEFNPKPVEVDQEGYFNIPSWPILDYLERTAPELQQLNNIDYADKYLKILREVSRSAIDKGSSNFRTWWYFAKIVKYIPIDKITDDDIELFDYWLSDRFDQMLVGTELGEHLLPRLLDVDTAHARKLATGLIRVLTSLTWHPRRWGETDKFEASLPVDAYHSEIIFRANARVVGEQLEEDGINIFRNRIQEIFNKSDIDKYSTIWRPAIEDHEQNKDRDDAENILINAFRDSLLGYVDRRASAASDYIAELFRSEVVLFQRVAIYVVGEYCRHFGKFVKSLIEPKYFQYQYQHEMYHFLQNCFSSFDGKEKEKVMSIISEVAEQDKDSERPKDIQEKQQAYTVLSWLAAIKGRGFQKVDDLYADNLAITEAEPEHPDFSSYMEDGWVGESSPYKAEELLSRDIESLIEILGSFKEEGEWKAPTRHGLSLALKEALKVKPDYFKGHLGSFTDLGFDYSYQLLEGYKDLWKEDQYDNWTELFEFCWALLQSEGFWLEDTAEQRGVRNASSRWIVGAIGELIRSGTSDDEKAFDRALLPMARRIIGYILEKQEGESFAGDRNAVSISINSARGKCVEALFNYSLRLCRLEDKDKNGHEDLWVRELQPIFDKQIDLVQEGNYEFVTLFTNYLPNLLYLSRTWAIKQLPIIFEKEDRLRWLCAVQGYTYVSQIYIEVYKFLQENSHLQGALDARELESNGKNKIIQNIVIAYFQDYEQLDDIDGTLCWLIGRWKLEELQQMIWFIWTMRGSKSDKTKKLLPLWIKLSNLANTNEEIDKRVLSRLCMWIVFVDELNEQTMNLLLRAAPYADFEHDAYILVKESKRLVDQYPDKVADIFISMLGSFAPTYKQEDIEYVITKLYEKGGEVWQKANMICDRYVEYGIGFPAEIRTKFALKGNSESI